MELVPQWAGIAAGLPEGWSHAQLRLTPSRAEDADHTAALLGSIGPGRSGDDLLLDVSPGGAAGPALLQRLLARLDGEGIGGVLELVTAVQEADQEAARRTADAPPTTLAAAWDALVESLPADWSDLLCVLDLRSSDELAPAALAIAPLNPSRYGSAPSFRFRVARRFGYGAAPEMARRCLARLDDAGIPGTLRLVEALSDTRPVSTQGPTFVVDSRAV